MEKTLSLSKSLQSAALVALGLLVMLICDRIKVPFYPIPFTMHTFGVAVIALTQPPQRTFGTLLLFTAVKLSMGLSLFGMSGGYFLAFPFVGLAISYLQKKWPPFFALLAGQALLYLIGVSWLSAFLGWKKAWIQGTGVFAVTGLLKNFLAYQLIQFWRGR